MIDDYIATSNFKEDVKSEKKTLKESRFEPIEKTLLKYGFNYISEKVIDDDPESSDYIAIEKSYEKDGVTIYLQYFYDRYNDKDNEVTTVMAKGPDGSRRIIKNSKVIEYIKDGTIFAIFESTKSEKKVLKESKVKNIDVLQLILEYYMSDIHDNYDLIDILIEKERRGVTTITNKTVYLEDFDVDLKSNSLELDLEESINKIINDNLQLFHFVDKIMNYCDKKHIKYDIRLYEPNKLDFTFDNFIYDEISELRNMIKDSYKIIEDEYLAGNGRWIIAEL